MLTKLTKRITHNFGLKVLAIVFAVVVWLIVVNVEDPNKTKAFTIPVTIENVDYLNSIGKTYEVLDNSDMISFTITGKRSIIEALTESDFTAKADLENIDETLSMIPVTVTAARYSNQIEITKRSSFVRINVENLVQKEVDLEVVTSGEVTSGFFVKGVEVNPTKITISGPESVVNSVVTAKIDVDVTSAQETIITNCDVVLYDANGLMVPQDRLTLNRTSAAVDVFIHQAKSIPVSVVVSGEPAEGFRFVDVTTDISEIALNGPIEAMDILSQIELTSDQLNLSGRTESYSISLPIANYLPENVYLSEGQPEEITVTVNIVGQVTKNFKVGASNIHISNLPENYQVQFENNVVEVPLVGFETDLGQIKVADLTGELDATGLLPGNRTVTVLVNGAGYEGVAATANITIVDVNAVQSLNP